MSEREAELLLELERAVGAWMTRDDLAETRHERKLARTLFYQDSLPILNKLRIERAVSRSRTLPL